MCESAWRFGCDGQVQRYSGKVALSVASYLRTAFTEYHELLDITITKFLGALREGDVGGAKHPALGSVKLFGRSWSEHQFIQMRVARRADRI